MMKTKYDAYVIYADESRQPEPLVNESMDDCDSVEEFVETIATLISDCFDTDPDDPVLEKLYNHDYETELDCDGEENYIHVIVRV